MRQHFKLIPAVYLILRKKNEVLLLQRQNTGYQDGNYSLIAGHVDGGELATTAMIREAKEEAGIEVAAESLSLVHLAHRLSDGTDNSNERIDIFFASDSWSGDITNCEPEKCSDLSWFSVDALPQNTIPLIKHVLESVRDGINFSEFKAEPV